MWHAMEQGDGNEGVVNHSGDLQGRTEPLLPILRVECDLRGRQHSRRGSQFRVGCTHTVQRQKGQGGGDGRDGCSIGSMGGHPEPSLVTWRALSDLWST